MTTMNEDPAIVAGKEAEAAHAAWRAMPHSTLEDEAKPEWQAAEQAWLKAGRDFGDTLATTLAGMFVKLRALVDDIIDDVPPAQTDPSWEYRHAKTILAFLEGFTGTPSVIDDDHPDAELLAFGDEWDRLMYQMNNPTDPDISDDEGMALDNRAWKIERRIIDTTPRTLAGFLVLVKLLARYQEIGPDFTDARERDLGRNILAALERLTPGQAEIGWGPSIVIDPAVAAFAELKAASAAFEVASKEEDLLPPSGPESPKYVAAYDRVWAARDAVRDAVPVSLAGVAGKVRAMLEYRAHVEAVGLETAYDLSAAAMLPFLEGAPRPAPKPDPVVTLFAEWGTLQDEAIALEKADPAADDPDIEDQRDKAYKRQSDVEDQIIATAATSAAGIAVKLRLMAYVQYPMQGLPDLYATPAKDTDFKSMILAWREDTTLSMDDNLLLGALRDAERLAGAA